MGWSSDAAGWPVIFQRGDVGGSSLFLDPGGGRRMVGRCCGWFRNRRWHLLAVQFCIRGRVSNFLTHHPHNIPGRIWIVLCNTPNCSKRGPSGLPVFDFFYQRSKWTAQVVPALLRLHGDCPTLCRTKKP